MALPPWDLARAAAGAGMALLALTLIVESGEQERTLYPLLELPRPPAARARALLCIQARRPG